MFSRVDEEAFVPTLPLPNLGRPILSHPIFRLSPQLARMKKPRISCQVLVSNMATHKKQNDADSCSERKR